ncbi:hypothetical protein RhiirA4_486283 [Rhizophagus irregularis]|uniref:Uncharacterized protein n=1 Tax=Rhizophagus irregularis TaxID=588596 RepID=A0A2I1HR97_9GLOM|nr:hypothetical protein RhiirA4_486283 [Rhizophagus irregularis]
MQFKNLLAFSSLFPFAGKNNYAKSVTHFLSYVNDDKTLQKLLQYICSVNLTQPDHYFEFDKALERFGAERNRLTMLLSEYVGDTVLIKKK